MSETAVAAPSDAGLKASLTIAYGLFLLGVFNGITAIAGVILVYVRRDDARGTIWEGHCRSLIRTFWIAVAVVTVFLLAVMQGAFGLLFSLAQTDGNPPPQVVSAFLFLVPALYLGAVLFVVWYLYRVVRGLLRALESRPA
jgi:uncharacterized membrane protein